MKLKITLFAIVSLASFSCKKTRSTNLLQQRVSLPKSTEFTFVMKEHLPMAMRLSPILMGPKQKLFRMFIKLLMMKISEM
ncbi:MAG: hypothetical protein IPN61_01885 [Bacteroidetes bacterium]|nr:hypothetical protein [Bacteroidota bacterium]